MTAGVLVLGTSKYESEKPVQFKNSFRAETFRVEFERAETKMPQSNLGRPESPAQ